MTRARWCALAAILFLVIGAATLAGQRRARPAAKPQVALLTSLPIVLGEGFSLKGTGSPVLTTLSRQFQVIPVSTTSTTSTTALAKMRLLLMAQPPPQTPENLVALDAWVRRGGRVMLLADPMLEWPSERPLGDPLRPTPMFADTGLLAHWGLRLDAPDQRGAAVRDLAGYKVVTVSPGALHGRCAISADRLVADCPIGKGRAIVIADADLLDVSDLGSGAKDNLAAVSAELESLANR